MIMAVKGRWICIAAALVLCACSGDNRQQQSRSGESAPSEPATPLPGPNRDAPPDSRPVIVAFGDSLTAGLGVATGKSYPDDLQRLIDASGYQYHVVNMG